MQVFSPHHVRLIVACYPPSSALVTSGPEYRPNSQELSRLTYYASNHPGKLNKLGNELEKRVRSECRKAQAGNPRSRASLLITLSIIKALATECRRDLSLLSPSLVTSVDTTLGALPSDLEVMARTASVFTAWTTFTDGHLIGADSTVTQSYLSVLRRFSNLSGIESKSNDHEVRNRTRLIGLAALTSAITSEALYNDSAQFRTQVSAIAKPLMVTLLQADLSLLDEQASVVKEAPTSPYLAEFRTRPATERRAASIHIHIDGDEGPSTADVANACLRALFALLEHSNGSQLGHIMRAVFGSLDQLNGWRKTDHCCWFAQKASEWAQYQYRYAVPTWLVERLLESQDSPTTMSVHNALVAMVTSVFNSPTPLVNLSTSDIISNLMTLLLRRITLDPEDPLLPPLVNCIASLGSHVYYSDQIQDLGMELINRLVIVDVQGVPGPRKASYAQSRSQAIRCLLAALLGLIRAADKNESMRSYGGNSKENERHITEIHGDRTQKRPPGRTKITADIWQDTLSMLCDADYAVRADYCEALIFYLSRELPKKGDRTDAPKGSRIRTNEQAANVEVLQGDLQTKFLCAIYSYVYILATTPCLGYASISTTPDLTTVGDSPSNTLPASGNSEHRRSLGSNRRSLTLAAPPRSRKVSAVQCLLDRVPHNVSKSASASASDYAHIADLLGSIFEQLPVKGLITGVPMLLGLESAVGASDIDDPVTWQRTMAIKETLARTWLTIAKTWDCVELSRLANQALSSMPTPSFLPTATSMDIGVLHPAREAMQFSTNVNLAKDAWSGVNTESALMAIVSCQNVQGATGLDRQDLLRRFTVNWTPESFLRDSNPQTSTFDSFRGDAVSPLLKISPALMHIENLSLQSLARSTRGVGVTDLREALEGRGSSSNPALAGPPSISTLDHSSSILGGFPAGSNVGRPQSRSKKRVAAPRPGEVRDVLNRLGIGKQNGSTLLKSSFPALQSQRRLSQHKS